jgi:hypothetical protein
MLRAGGASSTLKDRGDGYVTEYWIIRLRG